MEIKSIKNDRNRAFSGNKYASYPYFSYIIIETNSEFFFLAFSSTSILLNRAYILTNLFRVPHIHVAVAIGDG